MNDNDLAILVTSKLPAELKYPLAAAIKMDGPGVCVRRWLSEAADDRRSPADREEAARWAVETMRAAILAGTTF